MKGNKIFDFSRKGFQDIINIMTKKINDVIDLSNGMIPRLDDYISKIDWNNIINSDLYQKVLGKVEGYKTEADNNFNIVNEQLETNLSVSENIIGDLRIAFHYNFENNQEKLSKLKRLGFNCIWLYQQMEFTKNKVRLLKFLDTLQQNGIKCIVQVDERNVRNGVPSEIELINYVKNHSALIGFTGYDEPIGHAKSISEQEAFYRQMKILTNKLIFQVDNDSSATSLFNYYTNNSYDVFCIDVYTNLSELDTPQKRKAELFKRISGFMQQTNKIAPKFFIPIIPAFSGEGFIEPTIEHVQEYIEVLSVFNFSNYGFFAFNVPQDGFTDIDTSQNLENLVIYFNNKFYKSTNNLNIIKPLSFEYRADYESSANFIYDKNYGFEKIAVQNGEPRNNVLILKLQNKNGNEMLAINTLIRQCQDGETRKLRVSYSYNKNDYTLFDTRDIGPSANGYYYCSATNINKNANIVFIKIELDCTGISTSQTQDYIGIESISYSFI